MYGVNALNSKALNIFNKFVSLVHDMIRVEKCISCMSCCEKEFRTKWSTFSSVFYKYVVKTSNFSLICITHEFFKILLISILIIIMLGLG